MKTPLYMPLLLTCATLCVQGASAQQTQNDGATGESKVYKVTRADGTVVFTDTPTESGEALELRANTGNTATPLAKSLPRPTSSAPQKNIPDYTLQIVSPAPEATIRNNNGIVTIKTSLAPKNTGGLYQLWMDDTLTLTNSSGTFSLTGVNRGAHDYYVLLVDNKGKTLASSPVQTLYLHQASALINPQ